MTAWVVAGPAGSGKSTLGRALARATAAVLLDLDTATNPLLDVVAPSWTDRHWNAPGHRAVVRPARYAALLALAADQVVEELVLVAPFTAELRGGPEWDALAQAVSPRPVQVVWLDADADLLRGRLALRAEPRDRHAVVGGAPPAVPHLRVAADSPTQDQVRELLSRAAPSPRG